VRDAYPKIRSLGADVLAIGTGNRRYAKRFVEEESIPFPVLVDDHAEAAEAASVNPGSIRNILTPSTYRDSVRTWRRGHRIHMSGKRVLQLGATFVLGPGEQVRYEHIDATTTDHAPLDEVLAALDA
jgi:peroxiredoxin